MHHVLSAFCLPWYIRDGLSCVAVLRRGALATVPEALDVANYLDVGSPHVEWFHVQRTAAVPKGGGALEKYIGVSGLKPFINADLLLERMVSFRLPEVEGLERDVKGLPADLLVEICQGFVNALEAHHREGSDTKADGSQTQA